MAPPAARNDPWGGLRAAISGWEWLSRTSEIWWTRHAGAMMIDGACHARLAALVDFARERSAFYRDAYRAVPTGTARVEDLPVVTKRALMRRFDEWVTDPAVTRAGVDAFGRYFRLSK